MRLTDLSIKALKAPPKGVIYHTDDALTGFGVRVSEGGTKSFVLVHGVLRRRETLGRVGTVSLADARREAKRRLAEYTLGKSDSSAITWAEAVETYLNDIKRRLKPGTMQGYTLELTKRFRFADMKLRDLKPLDIQRRLDRLAHSPVQQHRAFVTVGTFMRWCYRRHYLETNPMDRMASGHRYRPRMRYLADEELVAVWRACPDSDFGNLVKALLLTGQRVGEITNLSPDMIATDTITLPEWLVKNSRSHIFPVGPLAMKHVKKLPMRKTGERSTARFENYQRHKARLDKASGVTGWTLHDLRRTFASGLASLGVSLPVTEKLLNHVSGSFAGIVGVYQRYNYAKEMREAVAKWEEHIQTLLA
ncbi:MAG: integrase arm-type DNA-binding domain-containing protein [Alphaproteobacteria bacterium]|nr:integrase arm-type DNA-binding domain-containing protein [Alphaproteobacteria bacterium]MBL6937743.1 integrase arm-type DNA-binding domain-containing protein [Alphaproteobacteria bacterium]MBL7099081.1 integrase arm-type DNA-binding domain-containing protein [Alphaproteobacteria bacterium]